MRLLAIAIVTACRTAPPPLTAAHRQAIVDSVQVMLTAWRDAFNARDFAHAASLYSSSSDFRWFENGELKFNSAAELRDTMLAEGPTLRAIKMSLADAAVTPLAPGIAAASATFTEMVTDTTGRTIGLIGAVSATVIHETDGWRFLVGHSSTLLPERAATPARRSPKS